MAKNQRRINQGKMSQTDWQSGKGGVPSAFLFLRGFAGAALRISVSATSAAPSFNGGNLNLLILQQIFHKITEYPTKLRC